MMRTAFFYRVTNRVLVNEPTIWYNTLNERVLTMDFHEKLQELRKSKGMTQEELAQALYVSRTAVSKWESGRGYPNIDSLKAIAKYFSVTVDHLLSGDQVLIIAEEDGREKRDRLHNRVIGLLNVSALLLLFLPWFGQMVDGALQEVSLLSLQKISPYLRFVYLDLVSSIVMMGVLLLVLYRCRRPFWVQNKYRLSVMLNGIGVLVFILGSQPYAAILLFAFLAIQVSLLMKR